MTKKEKQDIIIFSIIYYIITIGLMIIGTTNDLEIDKKLFCPQNNFGIIMEAFGQFVYWGIWGPIFCTLFVIRHSLNDYLGMINIVLPFVKPVKEGKTYNIFNKIIVIIESAAFGVLSIIGWKKLIENICKKFVDIPQWNYFVVCAVVTCIAILILSKVDKKTLLKLEGVCFTGILLGIFFKIVENCKEITGRIRFREMVAYSNNILQEHKGNMISFGELDKLQSHLDNSMVKGTDFGAFTPWYQKAQSYEIYDHANSFPSGHTTYSCTVLLGVVLCKMIDKLKKFMPFAFILSFCYIGAMAFSRLLTGAHYLTDVMGAAIIGYTLFLIAFGIYTKLDKKGALK